MGRLEAIAVTLLVSLAIGCVSDGSSESVEREQEARTMFEELISRGRPQPADPESLAGDDTFDRIAEEYVDGPDTAASVELPSDVSRASGDASSGGGTTGDVAQDEGALDLFSDLVEDADRAEPPLNPYLEFGPNIIWYPLRDGDTERLIMKPYTFPSGTGKTIFGLLQSYADFPIHAAVRDGTIPEGLGPQPQGTVLLDLREGFSVEAYADPRLPGLAPPAPIALSDVLFATATAADLAEVEHFIDLFAAEVRQIEIEAKIVEVTTRESLDLGVKPIDESTPIFGLPNPGGLVQQIDFSFANTADPSEALFQLGAVFDGVTFNAILEAVASFENVSIISRPKVAVREGGRADIVNVRKIPFYNVTAISAAGIPTTSLEFQTVGVQMYVIPRVIGRDTVVLNIDIEASQSTGTAASFNLGQSVITVPEISERKARTIVRLEPGQAVILGGLISERTLERETKVPLVGDIPILGQLFKSKLTSKEQTNVLFFIRPRILEGSDLNSPF
ncbi:MAG: type II and III secretion system protein [Planctomycetota bacterium]